MDSDSAKIIIRKALLEDKNFILATWLKGNLFGNYYFGKMHADTYYQNYSKYILSILSTPGVTIEVACDESSPEWIVGFIVYQNDIIHWAYVKKDFRNKGILRALTNAKTFTVATSITVPGRSICKKKNIFLITPPLEEKPKEKLNGTSKESIAGTESRSPSATA